MEVIEKPPRRSAKQTFLLFKRQFALQVMALMGVAWLIIFAYIPMPGIWIAFTEYKVSKGIFGGEFVGLKHFRDFLTDPMIPLAIRNTLGISLLNLTFGFVAPIIFALMLNEMRNQKFKKVTQTISYLPYFISWVILGGFMISWMSEFGLINNFLMKMGLIEKPLFLLGEPKYFWGVSVVSGIWKGLGWGSIIYLASIASVSPELFESAMLDGAGRMRRIWHIILPCIRPTIAILFTFAVAGVLSSNFDQIMVLQNNVNRPASTVLNIYVFRVGIQMGRFAYSTAVSLLTSLVSLVLLVVASKVSDRLTGTSFL